MAFCPVLNHGRGAMFLLHGASKAEMVRKALKDSAAGLPCQGVAPVDGELLWYVDNEAGAKLA